jgi:hypothetical protein
MTTSATRPAGEGHARIVLAQLARQLGWRISSPCWMTLNRRRSTASGQW